MTTPLATIADALIEFILSLLNDPAAAAEFDEDPQGTLARNGLGDACVEDVRAVAPVIVDRPDVQHKPGHHGHNGPNPPGPPSVEKEIHNITNSFSIDNRATIVDQSVNQNIWADGDVNQIFDQEAIVNSGDNGAAAGEDAEVDNSETDVETGDISVGNEDTTTNIDGSFNDGSTNTDVDVEAEVDESLNDNSTTDQSTNTEVEAEVDDSFNEATVTEVEVDVEASNEGNYESDDSVVVDDIYIEPEADDLP